MATAVLAGTVTFAGVWGLLIPMQRSSLTAIRSSVARFPTPPDGG